MLATLATKWLTNGDQDPGHPGPPISYEDRLGCATDLPLLKWRAGGFDYQGIEEAHQERTDASLREATLDIEAREKGKQREFERRKKAAANQNRRTKTNMGIDEGASGQRTSSSRKESSDGSKVRKDKLFKKSRSKDAQDEFVKGKRPMTSI